MSARWLYTGLLMGLLLAVMLQPAEAMRIRASLGINVRLIETNVEKPEKPQKALKDIQPILEKRFGEEGYRLVDNSTLLASPHKQLKMKLKRHMVLELMAMEQDYEGRIKLMLRWTRREPEEEVVTLMRLPAAWLEPEKPFLMAVEDKDTHILVISVKTVEEGDKEVKSEEKAREESAKE